MRLRGSAASQAPNVRVFFRLWTTQTNDTDYDVNGAYLASNDAAGKPGSPLMGAGNTTIPFFATNNFSGQTDYAGGPNIQTLTIPDHQDQLWAYYGCFLNLYDSGNVINGAQVQTYLNGTHHCIVAQIAFDDAPIPQSVSPLSWDQLAQRNLQTTRSDNPGPAATHRIPQTFDTRPGRTVRPPHGPNTIYPDELMIEWGNVPTGSVASLYWPQVHASEVLALAKTFYGVSPLGMSDANTIRIPITRGVSYVPIPPGTGDNFAGLITIDLPLGIRSGQVFDVTVKRLGTRIGKPLPPPPPPPPRLQTAPAMIHPDGKTTQGRTAKGGSKQHRAPPTEVERLTQWRYVVGTFQIRIPVTTGDQILPAEEMTLAIMKWRLEHLSPGNRWAPVLERYIKYISDRVDGLGGDASAVPPSLTWVPPLPRSIRRARAGALRQGRRGAVRLPRRVRRLRPRRLLRPARVPQPLQERRRARAEGVPLRLTLCVSVDGKDGRQDPQARHQGVESLCSNEGRRRATACCCGVLPAPCQIKDHSRRLALAGKKAHQVSHAEPLAVRTGVELFARLLLPIGPEGGIAEQLRAGGVPAGEGGNEDLFPFEPESIEAHLIGPRVGLVGPNRIRAQPEFEHALEPGRAILASSIAGEKLLSNANRMPLSFELLPARPLQSRMRPSAT